MRQFRDAARADLLAPHSISRPHSSGGAVQTITTVAATVLVLIAVLRAFPGSLGIHPVWWGALSVTACVPLLGGVAFAAVIYPHRRISLIALTIGLSFWLLSAAGSAAESVVMPLDLVEQVVLSLAYISFTGFIFFDVGRRRPSIKWIEIAATAGGAMCVVSLLALLGFHFTGVPMSATSWLALVHVTIDALLTCVLISQIKRRHRERTRSTYLLLLGFLLFTATDLWYALGLIEQTEQQVSNATVGYSLALGLIAATAVRPIQRQPAHILASRDSEDQSAIWPLVVAALVAAMVLAAGPLQVASTVTVVPALVTICLIGIRMMVGLRDAQMAAEAIRLSRTDDLTGLLNRRAIVAELDRALRDQDSFRVQQVTLMLLDLNKFKEINDSLGHGAGDAVLVTVAERLRRIDPELPFVGRLGGDEFAVLIRGEIGVDPQLLAETIRQELQVPFSFDRIEFAIDVSIGLTTAGRPRASSNNSSGTNPVRLDSTELLRRADRAMYEAKAAGGGAVQYSPWLDRGVREQRTLGRELSEALGSGQIVPYYQPQIDTVTGGLVSAEALVRWVRPDGVVTAPNDFLPTARICGLMPQITKSMVHSVVSDVQSWVRSGLVQHVSVNCDPEELLSAEFRQMLLEAIETAGLPGECVLVEVTEQTFFQDLDAAREVIEKLRSAKVQIAIDDYGAGFSSLAYLRDLPIQELKLDRTFTTLILTDERSRLIVESTAELARSLEIRVVAEGVENAAAARILADMGVDVLQGFYIGRPVPDLSTFKPRQHLFG